MNEILIFGGSDLCRQVLALIQITGEYTVGGIVAPNPDGRVSNLGIPIWSNESEISNSGIKKGIIAVGDNFKRYKIREKILEVVPDFEFVSLIHPSVIICAETTVDAGCIILAGAVLQNNIHIGAHVLIDSCVSLDHDNRINDFVSLGPGVSTGGNVCIGECTAIGLGANILHGISIGNHTVIGAGSLVNRDISEQVLAFGLPVRVKRIREIGERYL